MNLRTTSNRRRIKRQAIVAMAIDARPHKVAMYCIREGNRGREERHTPKRSGSSHARR